MSISEARALPTKELVQQLLTNVGDAAVIRRASHERLASFQETYVYDMCVKDARNGHPVQVDPPWHESTEVENPDKEKFPWCDEEIVLDWMRKKQVDELAKEVEISGYEGQFMANPEDAVGWVKTAIRSETKWRDLHPPGVRFWKALRSKWMRWMATTGR